MDDLGDLIKGPGRTLVLLLIALALQSCGLIVARTTYDFNQSKQDSRVYYENGAEDLALEVAQKLDENIKLIEQVQYIKFKNSNEIQIFVFADKGRYANYSFSSPKARGSAALNEIYISPIINKRRHTLNAIIQHELSHIHIQQYTGLWRANTDISGWYLEGLAVKASNGGGAETVSATQAKDLIRKGISFIPTTSSSWLGHKYASSYNLKHHVYYRQAQLFVSYLKQLDEKAFKNSYLALLDGASFESVWQDNYQKTIPELWGMFKLHIA